jgi:hypothetical protein
LRHDSKKARSTGVAFSCFPYSIHRPPMPGTVLRVSITLIVSSKDGVCDIVPDHGPRERGRISRARRGLAGGEGDDRTWFTPASRFGRDERINAKMKWATVVPALFRDAQLFLRVT